MNRLVLLGEGHGEVSALYILIRRLLQNTESPLFVDKEIVRTGNPLGLLKLNKNTQQFDPSEWLRFLKVASRRRDTSSVLAVYDGDADHFPAGSKDPFCAVRVAKRMAELAKTVGAGATFSLTVVFACKEYESWLVAGADSLRGQGIRHETICPTTEHESHGKHWLEKHLPGYRPTRHQASLTQAVDLNLIRQKNLRSFTRLENALSQLLTASKTGNHICTPV